MSRLAITIAVVPDVDVGREIYHLGDLAEDGIYKAMAHLHNQQSGTERLPLYQYRIASASVLVESDSGEFELISFIGVSESELLVKLAQLIDSASELISWNGDSFERPVLAYRYLKHGVACPAMFDQFSIDSVVHTTLSSEISGFQETKYLPLADIAAVLGLPRDKGLEHIDILESYQQDKFAEITQACDIDVLNTFLVSKRLELTKGELNNSEYQEDCDTLHTYLSESVKGHLSQFAMQWLPKNNR